MANTKFTGRSDSYIFEDAGGKRDQLEQAILNELQAKQYPLKATIQTLKGGKGLMGAVFAAKEQCVVVDVDSEAKIAISNTSVGSYLYVETYLLIQEKIFSTMALSLIHIYLQLESVNISEDQKNYQINIRYKPFSEYDYTYTSLKYTFEKAGKEEIYYGEQVLPIHKEFGMQLNVIFES